MSIRIFSKKAFALGPGAQRNNPVIELFKTVPGAFQDMPEKFADCATFKLAVKAGEITVIASKADEAVEQEEQEINDKAAMTELEAYYNELKVMNREDTITLGEKYNLTIEDNEKLASFKKRIFEAYKLTQEETE